MRFAPIALLLSLAPLAAQADSLPIATYQRDWEFTRTQYRFNQAQGTAHVQVILRRQQTVYPPAPGPGCPGGPYQPIPTPPGYCGPGYPYTETVYRTINARVPGLSFDDAAKQIVFNGESKAVCATVTLKGGLFGKKWIIRPTGECGFRVRKQGREATVYFETR